MAPFFVAPRFVICWGVLLAWMVGGPPRAADADELQYQWRPGDRHAYAFDIEVDIDGAMIFVKGTTSYNLSAVQGGAREEKEVGTGTGTAFVISSDGYLLSCAHVVNNATKVTVALGGITYPAKTIAMDRENDLALLKIDARDLPVLPLGDSDHLELAEPVRVVGFPLSTVLGDSIKITTGSVAGFVDGRKQIQVDAAINPGNSGGPLINGKGEVVGVASAKLAGAAISNVGFVVPSVFARDLLMKHNVKYTPKATNVPADGPALARQVTPSVGFVTVTIGGGGGGQRFAFGISGRRDVLVRSRANRAMAPKMVSSDKITDGKLVVDAFGDISQLANVSDLPFGLGSQGVVGLEPLERGEKNWEVKSISTIMHVVPDGSEEVEGVPKGKLTVVIPAAMQSRYEWVDTRADGLATIKKSYRLESLHRPEESAMIEVSGDGTLLFNFRAGRVESYNFSGTVIIRAEGERLTMPLRYKYYWTDPASIDGKSSAAAPQIAAAPGRIQYRPQVPDSRQEIPQPEARAAALTAIQEVFADEFKSARTSPQRLALADKLFDLARSEADPAQRFVLLDQSRTQAVQAGELRSAIRSAEEMVRHYRIEVAPAERAVLVAVAKNAATAPQHTQVAELAAAMIEEGLAEDRLEVVTQLGTLAIEAARKSSNRDLTTRLADSGREFKKRREGMEKTRPHREALARNPNDPAANLELGKYECFVKQQWDAGIPHLAKGSDAQLKAVAEKELAQPAAAADQLQVGDLWWQAAELVDPQHREVVQGRALDWYRRAQPTLTGLNLARVNKRLDEFKHLLPDAAPKAAVASSAGADVKRQTTANTKRPSNPAAERVALKGILELTEKAITGNALVRTEEVGFTLGGSAYSFTPPKGAVLVGFDISGGGTVIPRVIALRPIFLTAKGQISGPVVGVPAGQSTRVLARNGYAVSGLALHTSLGVSSLAVQFMKIEAGGLDPQDAYQSGWVGNPKADEPHVIGANALPVVGVYGRFERGELRSIGLIQAEKP